MEIQRANAMGDPATELTAAIPVGIEGSHAVCGRLSPPPAGPPGPSSTLDASGLLRAFQRRWPPALGLGVLAAAIAASAAWYLVPSAKYTAEALLLVEPEQPKLIAATREYRSDPETDRRTQVTLIKSPIVLSKVLSQPDVARLGIVQNELDPSGWLEREIKAEFTGKILRVALSGDKPTEVAALVKAVTDAYLSEVANKEKTQRLDRNEMLKGHYDKLQRELEARRGRLRNLATEAGSNDKQTLSLQQRLAITRQGMAEQELLRTQSELKHAMAELKVLQARAGKDAPVEPAEPAASPTDEETARAIRSDPVLQGYLQREEELNSSIEAARRLTRGGSDIFITRARSELNELRKRRNRYEAQLRSRILTERVDRPEARHQAVASLAALEDQVGVLTEIKRDLQDEVDKFTGDSKKLRSQAVEMEAIQDEIGSAVAVAKMIADEIEVLRIELSAPDRVKLLQEAKVPATLNSSKRIQLTGIAAGGAFGAVVFLLSFWEFRARKIDSQDDVVHGLGIRVIGTVPVIPTTMGGALVRESSPREHLWQHQLVESVDATRIMLAHAARVESHRVVLVTSAVGGEGKTSLATHLATSLARSGPRTLLIDGDLRCPMVHRLYDQPQEPGLCELLRDEVAAATAIRPTAINHLWIMPAGQYNEQAVSLLSQAGARALFDQLREQFDFIIVDSAPVLPVADTLLLSQHVDTALFSILRDVSRAPKIEAAYQRVTALGVPTLGAVVLGIDVPTSYRYSK